nr:RNA-directed DNA polymerase, eukaryota [Tanacetum cinerariifolium]
MEVESSSHVFFSCSLVRDIYRKIVSWWELSYSDFQNFDDWLDWLLAARVSSKQRCMAEGIFYVAWWLIWNYRNKFLFDSKTPPKEIIFNVLVSRSFDWCRYRSKASFSRVNGYLDFTKGEVSYQKLGFGFANSWFRITVEVSYHSFVTEGAKKEWGLSPKAKVRVLHTAQLDVTEQMQDLQCLKKGIIFHGKVNSEALHKTALIAEAQENIAKVQEKLDEEEIDKMVEGSTHVESYASVFTETILNDESADVDDTENKIEPRTQKKNPERVYDDDETEKEKVGKVHNIVEKEVVNETNVEAEKLLKLLRKKRRRNLIRSHIKKTFITREFFADKIQEVLKHCDTIVPELTVAKINAMIKKEMPRLVKLEVDKDREVSPVHISGMVSKEFTAHGPKLIEELFRKHMQNTPLNLYPKPSLSTATTSIADLQQQLYLIMKAKLQDQADLDIWEILKIKFEKP